jgi:hypothetical protein
MSFEIMKLHLKQNLIKFIICTPLENISIFIIINMIGYNIGEPKGSHSFSFQNPARFQPFIKHFKGTVI